MEIVASPRPLAEPGRQSLGHLGAEMEPGHLVLVLVRHQLEEVSRDRVAHLRPAGHPRLLGRPHLLDEIDVLLRVAAVLVLDQLGHTDRCEPERLALERRQHGAELRRESGRRGLDGADAMQVDALHE